MFKKLMVGTIVSASLITGGIILPHGSAQDPIAQTVESHTQELANHEARISNTENDVSNLQTTTNTPPSVTRVDVPVVSPPVPIPVPIADPQPIPITVTTVGYHVGGIWDGYCSLNYSDGTTTYIKDIGTVVGSTGYQDNCSTFVGQVK